MQETLFALDLGATNWRLFRAGYQTSGSVRIIGEPQPSSLTSFVERRLPAVAQLSPDGEDLEAFGDVARQSLENEALRERIRENFKPCIGSHLADKPLPHQKRYTHSDAMRLTRMLLEAVLDQLRREKWRGADFDQQVRFAFAYPVHWEHEHGGQIFSEFREMAKACFGEPAQSQVRFVAEPEGAILSLQRQGLLNPARPGATLIVDVGGSTTDLVAGRVDGDTGDLGNLVRYGGPHGGGLYDAEIAKFLAERLKLPASDLADDPSALISLRLYGRQLKEALSRQALRVDGQGAPVSRTITLVLNNGEIYRKPVRLDAHTFRQVCRHLIVDFEYLLDNGLEAMRMSDDEVAQAVLVGGGSKLFTVAQHLRERFGAERVVLADNPEEIVVKGVALEYGAHARKRRRAYHLPTGTNIRPAGLRSGCRLITPDGNTFNLADRVTTLGRKSANTVWLKDQRVSRFHAEIRQENDVYYIEDLGSSNGTFINDVRLEANAPHELRAGDELRIGQFRLKFTH